MIVNKINAYLDGQGMAVSEAILEAVSKSSANAFKRQFGVREEKKGSIRLSSIGHCLRKQAYNMLGYEANGKEIDSRARMVFFMGDLVELAILNLARLAGCDIQDSQTDLELDGISGHPDGIYQGHLVEIKSMSSYAFAEFQRGIIDEGYRYQCNSYMEAKKLAGTVMVGFNKDAGVLHEQIFSKNQTIVDDIRGRIARLKIATPDNLPPRAYSPNDKGFLPWNCLYCAYWKTCRPTAEKVLVKNAYRLKETTA